MKKFLSMVLALVMTMSLVTISAGAKDFTDDSKINYKEAVDVVSALKIVDGYADGAFNPQNTLTRGAAAKIICNLILGPTTASALSADAAPFKDVPANHEFAGYIAYCAQKGIINGYADGTFRPAGTLNGYAFMKMLLGALGYDGSKENYTGANWTINVAKQALGIDLDAGKEDFVGSDAVTREEACLYAFNTLQAVMVEYENKSAIVIGDITVNTSSEYKEKTNGAATETIKNDNKMQFAEQYFDNLKKVVGDADEFERPATTWKIKSASIGTYTDTPDATYTAEVKMGDIYKDLGLSSNIAYDHFEAYVDGSAVPEDAVGITVSGVTYKCFPVVKNDSSNKMGGNGVLTEVFYDDDADSVKITMINTYLGEVSNTYAASGSREAYITVSSKDGVGASGNFETDESFSPDDVVLYTYSNKTGDVGVQSVKSASEVITGKLSAYTTGKKVTVGGTEYKASKVYAPKVAEYNSLIDLDVTAYLDEYGYLVFLDDDAATSQYAVVLNSSTGSTLADRAKLLFADGSTKTVSVDSVTSRSGDYDNVGDLNGKDGAIVSYSVKGDGSYRLTVLSELQGDHAVAAGTSFITKGISTLTNVSTEKANTEAYPKPDGNTYANKANGKTLFFVASTSGGKTVYNTYTGIANAPTISNTGLVSADLQVSVYGRDLAKGDSSGVISAIFINAVASGLNANVSNKDAVFVKGNTSGYTSNGDVENVYVYDAIVDGEATSIMTYTQTTEKTLYGSKSVDSDGVYTFTAANGANATNGSNPSDGVYYATGTEGEKNGSVKLGTDWVSYSDNCKVFRLNSDGDILDGSYNVSSIGKDDNDIVWYKEVDGEATVIVIMTLDPTAVPPPAPTGIQLQGASASNSYTTTKFYNQDNDGVLSLAEMVNALAQKIIADGGTVTNANVSSGVISYTMNNVPTSVTVALANQVYKLTDAAGTESYVAVAGSMGITEAAKVTKDSDGTVTYTTTNSMPAYDVTVDTAYSAVTLKSAVSDSTPSNFTTNTLTVTLTGATIVDGSYDAANKIAYVKNDETGVVLTFDLANASAITGNGITLTSVPAGTQGGTATGATTINTGITGITMSYAGAFAANTEVALTAADKA